MHECECLPRCAVNSIDTIKTQLTISKLPTAGVPVDGSGSATYSGAAQQTSRSTSGSKASQTQQLGAYKHTREPKTHRTANATPMHKTGCTERMTKISMLSHSCPTLCYTMPITPKQAMQTTHPIHIYAARNIQTPMLPQMLCNRSYIPAPSLHLPHNPSSPPAIHTHSIIGPDRDTQARIVVVLRRVSPPQSAPLGLAPLGVDNEPGGAAVGIFLLHELQLASVVAAAGLGGFGGRRREKERPHSDYFEGEGGEGVGEGEVFDQRDFVEGDVGEEGGGKVRGGTGYDDVAEVDA